MSVNDRLKRKAPDDNSKNSRGAFGTRALPSHEEKQASRDLAARPVRESTNIRYSNPRQPGIIAEYLLGEAVKHTGPVGEAVGNALEETKEVIANGFTGGLAEKGVPEPSAENMMRLWGGGSTGEQLVSGEPDVDMRLTPPEGETATEEIKQSTFDDLHSTQAAGGMAQTYTGTKIEHSNIKHTVHHELMTQHTITHENFYYLSGSQYIHPFLELSGIMSMAKLWPETVFMTVDDASIDISNVYILDNKQDSTTGQVNSGLIQRGKCLMFKICSKSNNPFGLTNIRGTYYYDGGGNLEHGEGYYYDLDEQFYQYSMHSMNSNSVSPTGVWYPPDGVNFSALKQADNGRSLVLCPETVGSYKDWRNIAVVERQQLITARPWSTNQQTTGSGQPFVGDDRIEFPYAKQSDTGLLYSDMNVSTNDTYRKSFVMDIGVRLSNPSFLEDSGHTLINWWGWSSGGMAIDGQSPHKIDNRLYAICPPLAFGGDTPHFRLPIVTNLKGHRLGKVRTNTMRRAVRQGGDTDNPISAGEINRNNLMSCPLISALFRNCPNVVSLTVTAQATNGIATQTYSNGDIMTFPVWPNYDNPVVYSDSWGNRDASNYHNHGSYSPLCHYFICMQTVKDTAGNALPMAANFQLIHRMTTTQYLNDYWQRGTVPRNLGQLRHGFAAKAYVEGEDWNPETNTFL